MAALPMTLAGPDRGYLLNHGVPLAILCGAVGAGG